MNKGGIILIRDKNKLYETFGRESKEELLKEKELVTKLLAFYQKVYDKDVKDLNYGMFDYDFYSMGYNNDYGYYVVEYYHSKSYVVTTYADNIDDAFFYIACRMIDKKRLEYEIKNSKSIKKYYKNRFKKLNQYNEIFKTEYDLSIWDKYYDGIIPEKIISQYEKYINSNKELIPSDTILKYDSNDKKIVVSSNQKVRRK